MKLCRPRACALIGVVLLVSISVQVGAQTAPTGIPGPNVNIIGPTPDPAMVPDSTLKQKNEPLCAVRPDEPRQFFCVYNDYRGTDKPTIGDSWIGASMSRDEGLTWLSRLVAGFPNSPGSLNQAFAADPGIVAVPGMALVSFLAANRAGNQPGGLYLQRWVELNKEDGFPWAYADTRQISSGTAGQFRDKPAVLVTLAPKTNPPAAPLTLQLTVGGQPVTQKVAAGVVHVAYANFTGNDPKDTSQIRYLKSSDYGNTWSKEVKLSPSVALSQGVALAANGDTLVVHMTNWTGNKLERPGANEYYLAPVENVRVRLTIPAGKRVRKVALLVEAPCRKQQRGSILEVVIPRVEAYQGVRVDLE